VKIKSINALDTGATPEGVQSSVDGPIDSPSRCWLFYHDG